MLTRIICYLIVFVFFNLLLTLWTFLSLSSYYSSSWIYSESLFAENFLFYFIPLAFCLLVVFIKLKHIAEILAIELIIKTDRVSNLILLFNQVQLWYHTWMVCEPRLPHRKQSLNSVLNFLINRPFMKDRPETFKNGVDTCRGNISEYLTTLLHKVSGYLHRVLSRIWQEQSQHF